LLIVVKKRMLLAPGALFLSVIAALMLLLPKEDVQAFAPQGSGEVLIWDAGHGGADGGAVSPNGVSENLINLAIAQRGDALCQFFGVRSCLTREDENSLAENFSATLRQQKVSDTKNRVALVNAIPGGILISIHQNSLPSSPKTRGAIAFYNEAEPAAELAQVIQVALNGALNSENEKTPRAISREIYLTAHVNCPAVLVECGFLSNPEEEALLRESNYQTKAATAILCGYLEYRG